MVNGTGTKKQTAKIRDAEATAFLLAVRSDLYHFTLSRVGEPGLAEEIVQESILRYLEVAQSGRIERPRGYVFRIAFNLTINHFRKKRLRVVDEAVELDTEQHPGAEVSPEEWLQYKQFRDRFNEALACLSGRHQEIFYLRRMEGLTTAQIAKKSGLSRRMVQKYLAQVIRHFHNRLGEV